MCFDERRTYWVVFHSIFEKGVMADRLKIILAFLLFLGALILPLAGLYLGWRQWDASTGFILMAGVFLIMSILGGLLLLSIKNLSWLSVYMPYLFGAVYGFLPDTIPFSVDDAAATTAGAIITFTLALRKQSETPKWIIIPLLAAGIYALLGGFVPGPADEFLVDALALILAWIGSRQGAEKGLMEVDGTS